MCKNFRNVGTERFFEKIARSLLNEAISRILFHFIPKILKNNCGSLQCVYDLE